MGKRIFKRLTALASCALMLAGMVMSVPAERASAEEQLLVGYWSLVDNKVIYSGVNREGNEDYHYEYYDNDNNSLNMTAHPVRTPVCWNIMSETVSVRRTMWEMWSPIFSATPLPATAMRSISRRT